jgi:hypothetical protein
MTLHPHHISIASDNTQFHARGRAVTLGLAVDAAVALILKFPATSGRKSCFEKPKTPILGSKGGHRVYVRGCSRYERNFCTRNSKE